MRKIFLILLLLIGLQASGKAQAKVFSFNLIFQDSTELINADPYGPVFVTVQDTGATYTDTVKVYEVTRDGDTVLAVCEDYNNTTVSTFVSGLLTPGAGATKTYKVKLDNPYKLYFVRSNSVNISGRRTKVKVAATRRLY